MTALQAERRSADVLVVGAGVAALRAAIAAAEAGANVVLCCKGLVGRSGNTIVSTADISAYVDDLGPDDSADTFAADTLQSGASLADEQLVRLLAERSGAALLDLERLGIRLLRAGGHIDRTRAAGHSRARTYRAATTLGANKGLALSLPLAEKARELGVECLDRTPVVHIEGSADGVSGAVCVDLQAETVIQVSARCVIVAAGGATHLFARTNGTADATGDAIMFAVRIGAVARDMEFVQWHPTRMDDPVPLFLTNGLLADGAVFRDRDGREFMADYDARANLAPRDVLAKAVFTEAQAGRGIGDGVYLDCSGIPAERITLRHAYLAETLQKHGVDFPRQWLAVSPSTHFLMGGIAIDANGGSSVSGLFAAGEAAGGIHGGNRLGGNAFCEGLVFGTIAGESAAGLARERRPHRVQGGGVETLWQAINLAAEDPRPKLAAVWHELRRSMWQNASLVRDAASLRAVARTVEQLAGEARALQGRTPSEAARVLDLRAALDCAHAIVAAATFREESRGAHWRADFPETSPLWFGSVTVGWPGDQEAPTLVFNPKTTVSVEGG